MFGAIEGGWWTNGQCIRVRDIYLVNFHVQFIFIRATDYFISFSILLNDFLISWDYFNPEINDLIIDIHGLSQPQSTTCGASGAQSAVDQRINRGKVGPTGHCPAFGHHRNC